MRIVTSFGPSRIERQQKCLASWIAAGCKVTAVQSPGETELLQPLFPQAEFAETTLVGDVFSRPKLVRIQALIDQAVDSNVLILNADIEIRASQEEFLSQWTAPEGKRIRIGVRWNENPTTKKTTMFKWGIDAFLITPEMKKDINDIGMTMGCPAWDYWLPIHLSKKGYKIDTEKSETLIHEEHPRQWSDKEYRTGLNLLMKHYSLSGKKSAYMILNLTGRSHVK